MPTANKEAKKRLIKIGFVCSADSLLPNTLVGPKIMREREKGAERIDEGQWRGERQRKD